MSFGCGLLGLFDLTVYSFHKIGKIFSHYILRYYCVSPAPPHPPPYEDSSYTEDSSRPLKLTPQLSAHFFLQFVVAIVLCLSMDSLYCFVFKFINQLLKCLIYHLSHSVHFLYKPMFLSLEIQSESFVFIYIFHVYLTGLVF